MLYTIIGVLVAVAVWYFKHKAKSSTEHDSVSLDGIELSSASVTDSSFKVFDNCKFVTRKYGNDGDSFLVNTSKGETEFRLYYVDTCESWFNKKYAEKSAERLKKQGDYFGGLSQDQTIELGGEAKKFVKSLLLNEPFTVATKWESVYGSERMYCFVIVNYDGEPRYLHEILIAKGLARIHTAPKDLPDSTSTSKQLSFLKGLEMKAKKMKSGGWRN